MNILKASRAIKLAIISSILLTLIAISAYIYYLNFTTSSSSSEWSNLGTYLTGICSILTLFITATTALLLVDQIRDQKEINNFDRLIKHRSMFFECINTYLESEKVYTVKDQNKVYKNFFPNNSISKIYTITDTNISIQFGKLEKKLSAIESARTKTAIQPQQILRDLMAINDILDITPLKARAGDIIYNNRNFGVNIYNINYTLKNSADYIGSIELFLNSPKDISKPQKGYNEQQIRELVSHIIAIEQESDSLIYIYNDSDLDGLISQLHKQTLIANSSSLLTLENLCKTYLEKIIEGTPRENIKSDLFNLYINLKRNRISYGGHSDITSEATELLEALENHKEMFQSYTDKKWGKFFPI